MSTYASNAKSALIAILLLCGFLATKAVRAEPADLNIQNRIEQFIYQPPTQPPRRSTCVDNSSKRNVPKKPNVKNPNTKVK
jgi:hypothetical protein